MQAESFRWTCKCCGEVRTGLPMDLAFSEPGGWNQLTEDEKTQSHLDHDFCLIRYADGTIDRFIRAVLPIPVPELEGEFCFGVWVSVSEKSWDIYSKGFDDGVYDDEVCFGYLMHDLPDFPDTWLMHVDVEFQPGTERPLVFVHESDHPLVDAQANGVSAGQVERWVAPVLSH